jgi:uncharacterized membrane protein HdeD (DUF308 family)
MMSASNEATLSTPQSALFGDLQKNWGWLLAWGILSLVLGTLGFWMTFGLTLASVLFFGILLVVGGIGQLVHAFTCQGWKSVLWHVLIALLYVWGGIVMIVDPVLASSVLTLMLAWILIAVGVFRAIMAFQLRPADGWFWPLLSGVVSILLGAMIIAQWPLSGLWVIGLFVAIELVFNGWGYVFVALAARKAGQMESAGAGASATVA